MVVPQFGHNIVSPKFRFILSFLNLLEAPSLFEEYLFFSYDFEYIEHLIILFNANAGSRGPLIIFIALMVSPLARDGPCLCDSVLSLASYSTQIPMDTTALGIHSSSFSCQ